MSENEIYQQLEELCQSNGALDVVERLISFLTSKGRYHELFEALKMRTRLRLGLSAAQADQQERFDEDTEHQLELGLLDACRQVGKGLLSQGKIREGWMYLRPVGDRGEAARLFGQIEATDENQDELLEVLLHEGVDTRRGYKLALDRLGTCNSITLFEQVLASRPRSDQQVAAELLVRHVYRELQENLRYDISRREAQEPPAGETIEQLLSARPDLLKDGTYHLDTSHLASTVRFARVLDDPEALAQALDIAQYGRRLHPQYQYPGEEPFLDLYPASIAFFRALLGQQTDAAIKYFSRKADMVSQAEYGTVANEVLIDMLSRVGMHEQALTAFEKRIPADARLMGIAPTLLQLSQRLGSYEHMQRICQQRDDLLGFAAALMRHAKD